MNRTLAAVGVVVAVAAFAPARAQQADPPPPLEATTTTVTTVTTTEEKKLEQTTPEAPRPATTATTALAGYPRITAAERDRNLQDDEWAKGARFFIGMRGAMGFPPGGDGLAPLGGVELGVAARKGIGFGLHMFGAGNTPGAPILELPSTDYAFGATADLRYYLQSIAPLRLYPTLSAGFLAGPDKVTGKNAVLPLITPGFGARVNFADVYAAVELGAASFYIPFMALSVGWEPRERIEN